VQKARGVYATSERVQRKKSVNKRRKVDTEQDVGAEFETLFDNMNEFVEHTAEPAFDDKAEAVYEQTMQRYTAPSQLTTTHQYTHTLPTMAVFTLAQPLPPPTGPHPADSQLTAASQHTPPAKAWYNNDFDGDR
jgi:hypothetical protein